MLDQMNLLSHIYYIGGSPCSGKSTLAEMAADKYQFTYFKVDDHLEDYLKKGASKLKPYCMEATHLKGDALWMRDPDVQNQEELGIYAEIFEFILEDLIVLMASSTQPIITEGAAYLPSLMKQLGIDMAHYINLVPTASFQYEYYAKRPWVPYILADCHDKKAAFDLWMARDVRFAEYVHQQATHLGYHALINDGTDSIEILFQKVSNLMNWA